MSKRLLLVLALIASGTYQAAAQTRTQYSSEVHHSELSNTSNESSISPELTDSEKVKELLSSLEGTFEIEFSIPNYGINYTLPLLETIRNSRLQNENATIEWDQFTTITVFPLSTVATATSGN